MQNHAFAKKLRFMTMQNRASFIIFVLMIMQNRASEIRNVQIHSE